MTSPTTPLLRVLPILAISALTLLACQPDDRDLPPAAVETEPSVPPAEVSFGYIHHLQGLDHQPLEPLVVELPEATLRLERLLFVISGVELHLCAPTNQLATRLKELLIAPAHAHVPSSATRFGSPWVEDLLDRPGAARMAGGIAPPPGSYCEMHMILVPADDDAINLTSTPPEEIDGHTALISGQWRPQGAPDWRPFQWTSDLRTTRAIRLMDPRSGAHPLVLDEGTQVLLLLDKLLDPSLFATVEWSEEGPSFEPFLDDLARRVSIYRFGSHD